MADYYRTFVAIEIPHGIRAAISEHISKLRRDFADVRASWVRSENLHLTLKFRGDVAVSRVEDLSRATEDAARSIEPFELAVAGCGAFPENGQPKVLWLGINDPDSSLQRLFTTLEDRCADAGFEREARPYHPHLTIARLRSTHGSRPLATAHKQLPFSKSVFTAAEVVVFRSELHPQGSIHTAISRHPLR